MSAFASDPYLEQLKSALGVFIPATLKDSVKPKRESAIKKAYQGVYDIQCVAASLIGDIGVSHLLAMNDVVVAHLIEEYAKLNYVLKKLDDSLKSMNSFAEVSQATGQIKNAIKLKEIPRHLYQDLDYLSATFQFELDIKAAVDSIKSYEPPKSLLSQMGVTS